MLQSGQLVTLPVNLETAEMVGKKNILDIFYRPYTKKMWGIELDELDPEIIQRVKIRDDLNEYYFPDDSFQALPKEGYTNLVHNILDHKLIKVILNQPFTFSMEKEFDHIFNSMPIDEYFNFCFGELPYRSIKFHTYTLPLPQVYPVAVVNFTHKDRYTRVTEWKNLPGHGTVNSHTTLTIEEPCDFKDNNFERYYPVKDLKGINRKTYKMYEQKTPNHMTFIGRCGLYAYLDMHQAVSASLEISRQFITSHQI
jgi:UDP-galactopyranose mutase